MKMGLKFVFGEIPSPPKNTDLAYHYCSMSTLNRILESGEIRLYDVTSMNDTSEMGLAYCNWNKIILNCYQEDPFDFQYTLNGVTGDIRTFLLPLEINSKITGNLSNQMFHALCLSTNGNSLTQWRLYGDNGRGVCLGFSRQKLQELVQQNNSACYYHEIQYFEDVEEKRKDLARNILKRIRGLHDSNDSSSLLEYRDNILSEIHAWCVGYKQDCYEDEHEVRLVKRIDTEIILPNASISQLRQSDILEKVGVDIINGSIRTYQTTSLNELPLASITFGPQNFVARQNVQLLLASHTPVQNDVAIYQSRLPYKA